MQPKQLFEYFGIKPKRKLGQHFLSDPGLLAHIVALAELAPGDEVLEVGAGTGTLTRHLAPETGRVLAVEKDKRLIPILRQQTADLPNVEVVQGDILEIDVGELVGAGDYQVVANLPYYITSAIIRHLLEQPPRPQRLTLTVQEEVARRLVAVPGDMSLLTVSVQFYAHPRIVHRIKAGTFWPVPGVDSAVVRLDVYDRPPVPVTSERNFFRVVRAGFAQKRKQLKNALAGGLALKAQAVTDALAQANIDPRRRAETLSLDEWAALAEVLESTV